MGEEAIATDITAAETGEPPERAALTDVLRQLPIFADLPPAALADLASEIDWFVMPGGTTLCRQGDAPDALYVVLSGALGAYREGEHGALTRIGDIGAGETVGEMALLTGGSRTATVKCLRDTELIRLSRAGFEALLERHPKAVMPIARFITERLARMHSRPSFVLRPKTFAIVPHDPGVPVLAFAHAFADALRRYGATEVLTAETAASRTPDWFHRLETACDYLVYVADQQQTSWTRLCLRQVDCALLVARTAAIPSPWAALAPDPTGASEGPRRELVLLRKAGERIAGTAGWLAQTGAALAHHVETPDDMARVVRALTGRAVGLVLSGGGARGFAHIGVARALRQSGIPIDLMGGTSMGAIVAASLASGWDDYEVVARNRRCFVDTNPLADVTLPVVSLFKGAKVSTLLRREFGDTTMIEDLPYPFFCVTSNLTRGRFDVRDRGLLARWLRASVAIPGIIRPVFHEGEVNVDGGVINNLPVDVMRSLGRGPVIGVDVSTDDTFTAASDADADIPLWQRLFGRRRRGVPNILQILWRSGTVNSGAKLRAVAEQTDLLIQPPLESIDMLDWKAFDRAIEAGYAYTMRLLEQRPQPFVETAG